jgi:ubiquitin C-terminal hydrolase
MKNVWKGGISSSNPVTDVKALHRALCSFHPEFSDYGQHDIAECLGFLLDGIHEDLNRVTGKKPYVEDVERVVKEKVEGEDDIMEDEEVAAKAWEGYLRRNRSIIVDLFQGQLRSTLRCCNEDKKGGKGCGREVRKVRTDGGREKEPSISQHSILTPSRPSQFEPFMFLTLPVEQSGGSISAAVKSFSSTETMDGDNKWYCSSCKTHVRAEKKIEVWKVPPMLIIHLKRFGGRGGAKINAPVKFPLVDFDVSQFLRSPTEGSTVYDCYAVALHHGSAGGGHYTALGKSRITGGWYDLNDSHVGEVDPREVEDHRNAYVLFYSCMVDSGSDEEEEEMGKKTGSGRREVHIRRQSVSMPHLWPHMNKRDQPSLKKK